MRDTACSRRTSVTKGQCREEHGSSPWFSRPPPERWRQAQAGRSQKKSEREIEARLDWPLGIPWRQRERGDLHGQDPRDDEAEKSGDPDGATAAGSPGKRGHEHHQYAYRDPSCLRRVGAVAVAERRPGTTFWVAREPHQHDMDGEPRRSRGDTHCQPCAAHVTLTPAARVARTRRPAAQANRASNAKRDRRSQQTVDSLERRGAQTEAVQNRGTADKGQAAQSRVHHPPRIGR